MTSDRLKQVHSDRPFLPFIVRLADGRRLPVRHPEMLAMSPTGRTVVLITPDDAVHHLDVLMITDLEIRKRGESNGHARRRKAG